MRFLRVLILHTSHTGSGSCMKMIYVPLTMAQSLATPGRQGPEDAYMAIRSLFRFDVARTYCTGALSPRKCAGLAVSWWMSSGFVTFAHSIRPFGEGTLVLQRYHAKLSQLYSTRLSLHLVKSLRRCIYIVELCRSGFRPSDERGDAGTNKAGCVLPYLSATNTLKTARFSHRRRGESYKSPGS